MSIPTYQQCITNPGGIVFNQKQFNGEKSLRIIRRAQSEGVKLHPVFLGLVVDMNQQQVGRVQVAWFKLRNGDTTYFHSQADIVNHPPVIGCGIGDRNDMKKSFSLMMALTMKKTGGNPCITRDDGQGESDKQLKYLWGPKEALAWAQSFMGVDVELWRTDDKLKLVDWAKAA